MSCTKSVNDSHELPYADRAGWRWFKTLCTFFAIIYIKYDLHDIAFFFFLNATISFSTLCFCAVDFMWQVTQEHVRYWKQVLRKWFRQIHSGSDLTGDGKHHKLSVTLATRWLGKHTGIVWLKKKKKKKERVAFFKQSQRSHGSPTSLSQLPSISPASGLVWRQSAVKRSRQHLADGLSLLLSGQTIKKKKKKGIYWQVRRAQTGDLYLDRNLGQLFNSIHSLNCCTGTPRCCTPLALHRWFWEPGGSSLHPGRHRNTACALSGREGGDAARPGQRFIKDSLDQEHCSLLRLYHVARRDNHHPPLWLQRYLSELHSKFSSFFR